MDDTEDTSRWFDPASREAELPLGSAGVSRAQLADASRPVLGECLAAQRLLSANHVILRGGAAGSEELSQWGQTLATSIALLSAADSAADPRMKRLLRLGQRQILDGQRSWPDLASIASTAHLVCADHVPAEYGLPLQLYPSGQDRKLVEWEGFSQLVEQLVATVSPTDRTAWRRGDDLRSIATILFETFKNTHDHARTEADGADISRSIRAIFARFYPLAETVATIGALPDELVSAADRYVRGFTPRHANAGAKGSPAPIVGGLLEITVLDSGPGMAARWLKREVEAAGADEQAAAVVACFNKGQSTSGSIGRGFGLWKVLLSLSQLRGFMSIRTNGVHLYRHFGVMTRDGLGQGFAQELGQRAIPKEFFYDWKRGLTKVASSCEHVRGTVISFLLPMGVE